MQLPQLPPAPRPPGFFAKLFLRPFFSELFLRPFFAELFLRPFFERRFPRRKERPDYVDKYSTVRLPKPAFGGPTHAQIALEIYRAIQTAACAKCIRIDGDESRAVRSPRCRVDGDVFHVAFKQSARDFLRAVDGAAAPIELAGDVSMAVNLYGGGEGPPLVEFQRLAGDGIQFGAFWREICDALSLSLYGDASRIQLDG
uniref:Uncharacterized protein n=1 Tax=Marseillevirus LCMAC103 TaxID=2506604 RepID=A0A481YVG7_9VIRU|nr:MAG: hypothetical protein LCMAC103_03740 [Marseillevirus LCMAC103]